MLLKRVAVSRRSVVNVHCGGDLLQHNKLSLMIPRGLCIAALLIFLSSMPAWGQSTYWNLPVGQSGNWSTAANWTAGEPAGSTYTYISNGGTVLLNQSGEQCFFLFLGGTGNNTLQVSGGSLLHQDLYVGYDGNGSVIQTGGSVGKDFNGDLYLGYNLGDSGTYQMSGASSNLNAEYEYIGYNGTGQFTQTGGTNFCWGLSVNGTYSLSGTATLQTSSEGISGTFTQNGGTHSINSSQYIGRRLGIGSGGKYFMNSGMMKTPFLSIDSGGLFQFNGGSIQLTTNYYGYAVIENKGVLDGAGSSGYHNLIAPANTLCDFSEGSIVNAKLMTLIFGSGSLVILPAGFSTGSTFGTFINNGVTYTKGTTFSVPAGRTCNVQPYDTTLNIDDPVNCQGSIYIKSVTYYNAIGNGVNFNKGLTLSGSGSITGMMSLTVNNATSGMSGGTLDGGQIHVGKSGTGTFNQSAGTCTIGSLTLGENTGDTGTYTLSNNAALNVSAADGYNEYIGYSGAGNFIQTGGTNILSPTDPSYGPGALYLGYQAGSSGSYTLGSGTLKSAMQNIGYYGTGTFTQTGGSNVNDDISTQYSSQLCLGRFAGSNGTYDLRNGPLSVGGEYIGYDDAATALFMQSGGTNTTSYMAIGPGGTLRLSGGTLQVNGSLLNRGVFDGSGSGTLIVNGGITDLASGTILNPGGLALTVGSNTLLIVPAGFDPETKFRNYLSSGVTYIHGESVTIPANQSITGNATFSDHVTCLGTLTAASQGKIDLNAGLTFSGSGNVNLGSGKLTVEDATSGMSGGVLASSMQNVGEYGTGVFTQAGGSNTISGNLVLGSFAGANGTYSLSDSATVSALGEIIGANGSASFIQTGGTNTVQNPTGYFDGTLNIAPGPNQTSSYTLSGSGVLKAPTESIGGRGLATFTQSGGTNTVGRMGVSSSTGGTSTYNLSDTGVINAGSESIGVQGIFNQSGGTNNVSSFYLGYYAQPCGIYNLSGGLLAINQFSTNTGAIFNFSGGMLQIGYAISTTQPFTFLSGGSGAVFNTNGNTLTLSGKHSGLGGFTKSGGGAMILSGASTYSGGTTLNAGSIQLGADSVLTGGSLTSSAIGTGSLTLRAGSLSSNGTTARTLYNAVTFDGDVVLGDATNNGTLTFQGPAQLTGTRQLTINSPVVYGGAISGSDASNGLTKLGGGTLTLNGANSYTGPTTIAAGKLYVNNSLSPISNISLADGTRLGGQGSAGNVTVAAGVSGGAIEAGQGGIGSLTLAGLTFAGNGSVNLANVDAGANASVINAGMLIANGSTGSVAVNVSGPTLYTGTYKLVGYTGNIGGTGGFDAFTLGTMPAPGPHAGTTPYQLVNNAGEIDLQVTNDYLVWTGAAGAEWSTATIASPKNWKLSTTADATDYMETANNGKDTVLFDDSVGSGSRTINIAAGNVQPAKLTFNNGAGVDYTLQSSGGYGITGTTGLTKSGQGVLTITTANSYSGDTVLNAGRLQIGNSTGNALGTGKLVLNGGVVSSDSSTARSISSSVNLAVDMTFGDALNNGSLTFSGPVALAGTRQLTINSPVVMSGIISGSGCGLIKSGSGVLTLAGTNTYSGGVTLNAGQLNLNNNQALGTAGTFVIAGDGTCAIDNTSSGTLAIYNGIPQAWNSDFTFLGTQNLNLGSGLVTLGGDRTVRVNANLLITTGVISGNYMLTKTGAGSLALYGANTYSGGTVLSAGRLCLNGPKVLGATSGTFTIAGDGTCSIDNTYGGPITISNNNAQLWNADFTFVGSNNLNLGTGSVTLGGNRQVTVNLNTLTVGGNISGNYTLTKAGPGALNLAGPNTFAGPTYLNAGTIQIGIDSVGSFGNITSSPLGMDSLIISGGAVTSDGSTARTVINPVTFAGDAALGAASNYTGVLTFQAPGTLTGNRTLTVNSPVNFASTLGDGGIGFGLTKAGSSKLTLSGVNTYSGPTTVSAGSLQAITTAALPGFDATGKISVNNGGTLVVNYGGQNDWTSADVDTLRNNATFAAGSMLGFDTTNAASGASYASDVSGGLALNKLGPNALTLSGTNSHTGGTMLTAGQLNINNAQALGTGTFIISGVSTIDNTTSSSIALSTNNPQTWNANFIFAGSQDLNLGNGPVTLGYNRTVTISSSTLTVGGAISGAYSLTKAGSGTLALGGANTYSGTTSLGAGTLFLQNQYALQNSVLSASAGTLVFDAAVNNHAFNFGGLSGSINLDLRDTSANPVALTVANSGSNSFSGVIGGSGSLTKTGNGTLYLTGANTFSGKTTVNAGMVAINSESSLGTAPGSFTPDQLTLNGGTLQNTATLTLSANRGIYLGSSGGSLRPYGNTITLTVASVIDGPGSLTLSGSGAVTLSGVNTYTGGTNLNSGQLNITNPLALGSGNFTIGNSGIDNTSGSPMVLANHPMAWNGYFTFVGTQSLDLGTGPVTLGGNYQVAVTANALTVGGVISSNYGITKYGNGTLVLSGNNTYTGPTNINLGTIIVNGSLGSGNVILNGSNTTLGGSGTIGGNVTAYYGSTISPGNTVGTLTLSRNLTLNSGALFKFDLATPGSSDQISMPSSTLYLNNQQFSDFTFTPQANFAPGTFVLIDAGLIQNGLGDNLTGTINGFPASISAVGNDLLLIVVPEPSTLVMLSFAAIALLGISWRRRNRER